MSLETFKGINKYRKKPVVIEAIQWDGNNDDMLVKFSKGKAYLSCGGSICVKTLEGVMTGSVCDYLIRGVKGEFYFCKPDIFKMTHDLEVEGESKA